MDTIGIVRSARSNINSHACIHIRLYISCHMPNCTKDVHVQYVYIIYNHNVYIIYNYSNIICIYIIYIIYNHSIIIAIIH